MKILIHYGELALKGKNRSFFEKALMDNIKKAIGGDSKLLRLSGRFLLETQLSFTDVKARLLHVFGVAWLAQVIEVESYGDLKKLLQKPLEEDFKSFAVRVNRVDKNFPKTSLAIEKELGALIKKVHNKKVDLENPDTTFWVEILYYPTGKEMAEKGRILLFTEKTKGLQGLPVGVSGRLLVLLSGGIDSPVAAYMMLKRGVRLGLVHFHSFPYLDKASIDKCKEILEVLRQYQPDLRLYLVPIFAIQKKIKLEADNRYLVVLYRRLMLKIAASLALKQKAGGLVTGDSLGQVASQTLENIRAINESVSSKLSVFRPLIGFNKEEIIRLAEYIGTYTISIRPHQDCCSLFVPKHPTTRANLEKVKMIESLLKLEKLTQQALKEIEVV